MSYLKLIVIQCIPSKKMYLYFQGNMETVFLVKFPQWGKFFLKVSKQIRYLIWRQKLNDEYCPLNLHRTLNFYVQYSDSKQCWYNSMHWLSKFPSRCFVYVHVKRNMNYIYWKCSPFEFPEDKQRWISPSALNIKNLTVVNRSKSLKYFSCKRVLEKFILARQQRWEILIPVLSLSLSPFLS